jgi:hypothetical protein
LDVPELRDDLQIVRGHPHAFLCRGALLAKIRFTLVDEEHRIGLAVVAGKIQFLESWGGGQSRSRGPSGRPPASLSTDEADFFFIASMSAFMVFISVMDFNISITSAMVGSLLDAARKRWTVAMVEG